MKRPTMPTPAYPAPTGNPVSLATPTSTRASRIVNALVIHFFWWTMATAGAISAVYLLQHWATR